MLSGILHEMKRFIDESTRLMSLYYHLNWSTDEIWPKLASQLNAIVP